MPSTIKERRGDVIYPGRRDIQLVTSALEHEARLRADPERQRSKCAIDRASLKELALLALLSAIIMLALLKAVMSVGLF
jgi:hypothetical protein